MEDSESQKNDGTKEVTEVVSQELVQLKLNDEKHPFWDTQPMARYSRDQVEEIKEGPIDPPKPLEEVKSEPYNLPMDYEWATCDIEDDIVLQEVYTLLSNNYVEDDDNMFRFDYSKSFLKWALQPPGYFKEWLFGVRVKKSRKLVGFISGVPANIRAGSNVIRMAEINFLCVHKKLRSMRLAPVLIKEVTRRVHLTNIWQAVYTGGALLPTPIARCRYWHRPLNPKKLIDVGFSRLGARMTMNRTLKLYKTSEKTVTPGLRKMEAKDVPAVTKLLADYLSQFVVAPSLDEGEVEHMLLPLENVVQSFVVESPETGEITDFCSFYSLSSTIIGNTTYSTLRAAYSFYNVARTVPLLQLMSDLLISAKQLQYDVFNALDLMQNSGILKELKFGAGDGYLHYYLYNYQLKNQLVPSQLGLVLL